MLRKLFAFTGVLLLSLSLVACGGNDPSALEGYFEENRADFEGLFDSDAVEMGDDYELVFTFERTEAQYPAFSSAMETIGWIYENAATELRDELGVDSIRLTFVVVDNGTELGRYHFNSE